MNQQLPEGVIRTPDERFQNLSGYPFEPNYLMVGDLRMHYLDEGPPDANPVLLLHGEPSWSYLYRKMIPPLIDAGHRVAAPDLIGFGRSDKFLDPGCYSYQSQVDWTADFLRQLGLDRITLFVQDWGGLIGLRLVALFPDRFDRIVVSNTGLPDAGGLKGLIGKSLINLRVLAEGKVAWGDPWEKITITRWMAYARQAKEFPVAEIIQAATFNDLPSEVLAGYEAPFPDDRYLAAARVMPSLIPTQLRENHRAWKNVLEKWEKPFLTAFSDRDPITREMEGDFRQRVPGARGQPHVTIQNARHFVQEDKGEELARVMIDFINSTEND